MSDTPNYLGPKRFAGKVLTSSDGTTLTSTGFSGAVTGTRVESIRIHSGGTASPGSTKLAILISDGTTDTILDIVTITNTLNLQQAILKYNSVYLPSSSHSIKLQMTISLAASSNLQVQISGSDY